MLTTKCIAGHLAQSGLSLQSPNTQGQQKELIPPYETHPPWAQAPRWLTGACGRSSRSADRPVPQWACTRWAWISPRLMSALGRRASHSDLGVSWEWCTLEREIRTKLFTWAAYVAAGETTEAKTQRSHSATHNGTFTDQSPISPKPGFHHLWNVENITCLVVLVRCRSRFKYFTWIHLKLATTCE